MQSILQTAVTETIKSILSLIERSNLHDLAILGEEVRKITDGLGLQIMKAVIEETDRLLRENKKLRSMDGLKVQNRHVPRTLTTMLGDLTFERTYYAYTDSSGAIRYTYLTDSVIGLEPYERITKDLIAGILTDAAKMSYREAVNGYGMNISAQTVHDRLTASPELAAEAERVKETPEVLDLFADEDHVHLNSGRAAIVPLVAVTEGIDQSRKRHRTIRPFFLEGCGMENGAFLENLLAVLEERYDLEKVRKIRLHCDGGNWIRSIPAVLPNVTAYMDGYHIEKHLKWLQNRIPDPQRRKALRAALNRNDEEAFFVAGVEIAQETDQEEEEKVHEVLKYFRNNWESIQNRKQSTDVCGSCTEGLAGNILSARLSRNPMGWSPDGLKKMAALRVYWKNGNRMMPRDVRVSRKNREEEQAAFRQEGFKKYRDYAEKQTREYLQSASDWSIFNPARSRTGMRTGTTVLLRALSATRDALSAQ